MSDRVVEKEAKVTNPNIDRLREYLDATDMGDWSVEMEVEARRALDALAADLDAAQENITFQRQVDHAMRERDEAYEALLLETRAAESERMAANDYLARAESAEAALARLRDDFNKSQDAGDPPELPVPVRLLSTLADAWGTLVAAEHAGEHPHALYHLRQAVDALERAHRSLADPAGTAVVRAGEAEPPL